MTKQKSLITVSMVLLAAMFILTPRYVDPAAGGETESKWVAARILADTGGFPVYSHGPLYCVYLQAFRLFDYPLSVRLEHIVTHFFAQVAIYLMLLRFLSWPLALVLSCAWVPYLALLHPGGMVLGIAFTCLYFRGPGLKYNQGYFPVTLLAAALCHSAFLPFCAGHTLGEIIRKKFNRGKSSNRPKADYGLLIAKGFMFLLIVLTIVLPSRRWDHNHMFINQAYCPIPQDNALVVGFFQIGTWKEIVRDFPPSMWISQDWYFATPRIYKGAQTIWQAVLRVPDVVEKNLLENVGAISVIPRLFTTGDLRGGFALISLVLFPLGFIGMWRFYEKDRELLPEIMTILVGSIVVIFSLLLTWFAERYTMPLLPVGLFCLCFISRGIDIFLKGKERIGAHGVKNKPMFITGAVMIAVVFLYNPLVLGHIFRHGLSHDLKALSVAFDILFLIGGSLFIADSLLSRKAYGRDDFYRRITTVVILFSAGIVFLTAPYPNGRVTQLKAVIKNEGLFDGTMNRSYKELLKGLHRDSKILTDERMWVKAFGPLGLDNTYDLFDLPPYADNTGRTRAFLNSLDAIWITSDATVPEASISTQIYLRYKLHIEPFLKDAVQNHHWQEQELPGYGTIYRRE